MHFISIEEDKLVMDPPHVKGTILSEEMDLKQYVWLRIWAGDSHFEKRAKAPWLNGFVLREIVQPTWGYLRAT